MPILVIGDLMIDHYISVEKSRINPEAPTLIFKYLHEWYQLGGTANVAKHIKLLSNNYVELIGDFGHKYEILEKLLKEFDIKYKKFIFNKKTTIKTRIICDNYILLRIDNEDIYYLNYLETLSIIDYLEKIIDKFNIIVISDYQKGVITDLLLKKLFNLIKKKKLDIKILIDFKNKDLLKTLIDYSEFIHCIFPNKNEFCKIINKELNTIEEFKEELRSFYEKYNFKFNVFLKLSKNGCLYLFNRLGGIKYFENPKVTNVVDVTGAGDVVIATYATELNKLVANKVKINERDLYCIIEKCLLNATKHIKKLGS